MQGPVDADDALEFLPVNDGGGVVDKRLNNGLGAGEKQQRARCGHAELSVKVDATRFWQKYPGGKSSAGAVCVLVYELFGPALSGDISNSSLEVKSTGTISMFWAPLCRENPQAALRQCLHFLFAGDYFTGARKRPSG